MRIGVDVDDVLFPWGYRAHALCKAAGITNGKQVTQWEAHLDYGVPLQSWLDAVGPMVDDGSYLAAPYEGVQDALARLQAAGHTIHLVTARGGFSRGSEIRQQTIQWLSDWEIPYDALTFSKDKTVVNVDVFIDDSLKNYDALVAAGVNTYLVNQPHNGPWFDRRQRVNSFVEFADLLCQ